LAERASAHGIVLAYEALAWGRHVNDPTHAWKIVEYADHPNLGTCLDSFHVLSRGWDPAAVREIPGDKIVFLQLADAPLMAMDVLQWSRHYRCFPGQGGLDVAGLVSHALAAGYTGPLSLEIFNDVFRQSDSRRTAKDAMRSLLALEDDVSALLPTGHVARVELTPPRHAPAPTGFAFTEVAAGPGSGLDDLLVSLGFTPAGQHRSKSVRLWQQGRARMVVNAAPEGARAGSPSLTAIGLESTDPERAAYRAEDLLSPVLPREWGEHEVRLDAVAAPDGTALFFCRTGRSDHADWLDDFLPLTDDAATGAGITHVDHVALTQPWSQFDEAALFYRAVLGMQPHDSLDLADPYGLLRSRAMAGPDNAVRIALNVAPAGHERQGHTSHAQHVALACDDIVATARILHARGAPLLAVPGNYYDDLEARYDLAPGLSTDLRELGLLYDRDEHGEFLHLYTQTVGQVFFEVVQRVGRYAGYGAQNASVRLTAQHTHGNAEETS
ncbi:MAG: bifunctional sugar phosphate isomerase/epimerase/4-hydroxyphenylpyruvate dioxygenase family protein, partial [Nocardioidaceae bacterium]